MRSHREGSESATTQVKVLSPEIICNAQGQGFHFLETNIGPLARGESGVGVPGSKAVAGKQTVYSGTWENRSAPSRSFREAEEATRRYGVPVVGLTRSKGVDRVTPVEHPEKGALEGVSNLTQRENERHARH